MSKGEVWRDVIGYEGLYKVSNKGNVYSVERLVRGRKYGGHLLKPAYHMDGYTQVDLYKNGVRENKLIHRLVAEVFIPNQNSCLEINHKDENKTNNNVSNLEWCTKKYNINHGTRTGRAAKKTSNKVKAVNVVTGEVLTFNSTQEAGRKGYDQGNVAKACRGVYKSGRTGKLIGDGRTYRGHRWYYKDGE